MPNLVVIDPVTRIEGHAKITIALDDKFYSGEQFVISTKNNSAENTYIQSARLDGRPLSNAWFSRKKWLPLVLLLPASLMK